MNIYLEHGFPSRKAYILDLAENLGVPAHVALMTAQLLGASEDFDGLVTELSDYADSHPEGCSQ